MDRGALMHKVISRKRYGEKMIDNWRWRLLVCLLPWTNAFIPGVVSISCLRFRQYCHRPIDVIIHGRLAMPLSVSSASRSVILVVETTRY